MNLKILLATLFISFLSGWVAQADNLHLIESRADGFAIYRSGSPTPQDFKAWCQAGIQEVYVLSGNADIFEDKMSNICPQIKVFANEAHDVNILPNDRALELFDQWVLDAQKQHKKILFRCNCGCHRTGRMAAYYQMKYQHLTAEDAIALMNLHGQMMMFHPQLIEQVYALERRIKEADLKQAQSNDPAVFTSIKK